MSKGMVLVSVPDRQEQALDLERSKWKTNLENLERKHGENLIAGNQEACKKLENKIRKATLELGLADLSYDSFRVRKVLKASPNHERIQKLEKLVHRIAELKGEIQKEKNKGESALKGGQFDEIAVDVWEGSTVRPERTTQRDEDTYSDSTIVVDSEVDNYVSELANDLLSKLPQDSAALIRVASILADKFGDFALKVGCKAPGQIHRDVMAFIYERRYAIARQFREVCPDHAEEDTQQPSASAEMSLADKIDKWRKTAKFDAAPPSNLPLDLEEEEGNGEIDVLAYREFIVKSPVYQWLVETLQRECYICRAEEDLMAKIRITVLRTLPSTYHVNRKASSETFTVHFHMRSNILKFLAGQEYGIPPEQGFLYALTLTATSESHVQCLPCGNYIRQMWPVTGSAVVDFISAVLADPSVTHKCSLPDNTSLTSLPSVGSTFSFEATGTANSIAELAEVLCWVDSAFTASYLDQGVAFCQPTLNDISDELRQSGAIDTLSFGFAIRSIVQEPVSNSSSKEGSGRCWHDMFQNPVVVFGYPILRRPQHQAGLEIPLNVMAALLNEDRVNTFKNRPFIKGFNAMLALTKCVGEVLLWHLFLNEDGSRISYNDLVSPATDVSVQFANLETGRHIVGWCSNTTYLAGAPDANYAIERSRLRNPRAGIVLDKFTVSGGMFVTLGLTFARGNRDKSVRIKRGGYIANLEWISDISVVFWDEGDKRGWLVNGPSALLHLVRASLEHNRQGKFRSAYVFNAQDLVEASCHSHNRALEILLNEKNKSLELRNDDAADLEENDLQGNIINLEAQSMKERKKYYSFKDRVEEIIEKLDKIKAYEDSAREETVMKIRFKAQKHLKGWEFKDVATRSDSFYPRVAKLRIVGEGWTNFVKKIGAITLFGEGFGDLIRPTADCGMCGYWATLPKGQYYLAATLQDLKEIAKLHGDPNANPMRLDNDILWHNPGPNRCDCRGLKSDGLAGRSGEGEHSNLAQLLLPGTFSEKNHRRPGPFEAFVFGHKSKFLSKRQNHSEPAPSDSESSAQAVCGTPSATSAGLSASASTFSRDISETTKTSLERPSDEHRLGPAQQVSIILVSEAGYDEDEEEDSGDDCDEEDDDQFSEDVFEDAVEEPFLMMTS